MIIILYDYYFYLKRCNLRQKSGLAYDFWRSLGLAQDSIKKN